MSERKTGNVIDLNSIKLIECIINTKVLKIILFLLSIIVVYKMVAPARYSTLFSWIVKISVSLPIIFNQLNSRILSAVLEILMLISLFSLLIMFILACFSSEKYSSIKTNVDLLWKIIIRGLLLYAIGITINYLIYDINIIFYFTDMASIWEQCAISLFLLVPFIIVFNKVGRYIILKLYDIE